jgi:hypothetical protein
MTSVAQLEANRANALHSTGPRTVAGKARSACNATTHGLTSRVPVAISRGPFAEDPGRVQSFIDQVVRDLEPVGVQEQAEATHIAALYVRLHRLLGLEAAAVTASTRATVSETLQDLADPYALLEDATGQERLAGRALSSELMDRLPRYEAHLSRELDRSLARYRDLQELRRSAL